MIIEKGIQTVNLVHSTVQLLIGPHLGTDKHLSTVRQGLKGRQYHK